MDATTIYDIPHELLRVVIICLRPRDYYNAVLTCRAFYCCMMPADRTIDRFLVKRSSPSDVVGRHQFGPSEWIEYNGNMHGHYREWNLDGTLRIEIEYWHNIPHGITRAYRHGLLFYEENYMRGRLMYRRYSA